MHSQLVSTSKHIQQMSSPKTLMQLHTCTVVPVCLQGNTDTMNRGKI